MCTYSEHAFHQQRWHAKVRISKQYMLSNCFIWSRGTVIPRGAHRKSHAQDSKWADWKIMFMHALEHSNVVQNSPLCTTSKASMWSPSLQTFTSQKYTALNLCLWWLNWQEGAAVVKQMNKYAEPMAENGADLTDRFSLLWNNDLFTYMTMPFRNLIKSTQNASWSKRYVFPFTSSHPSVHVCVSDWIPSLAH